MAVVKLKEVSIIGKLSDIDDIATVCGKTNAFHADNALTQYADAPDFTSYTEENPYAEPLQQLTDAMDKAGKTLTLLSEKESQNLTMDKDEMIAYAKDVSSKISEWEMEKIKAQEKVREYTAAIQDMGHFVGLDLDLDEIKACEYVNVRFGSMPKENVEKLAAYKENPNVIFTPCVADEERQWGLYFAPIANTSEVDRIFNGLKFEKVTLETMSGSPEKTVEELRKKCDAEQAIVAQAESNMESLMSREASKIQQVYTLLTEKNVYFSAICRNAARYDDNFVIVGWIPKEAEAQLKAQLGKYDLLELSFKNGDEVQSTILLPPSATKGRSNSSSSLLTCTACLLTGNLTPPGSLPLLTPCASALCSAIWARACASQPSAHSWALR